MIGWRTASVSLFAAVGLRDAMICVRKITQILKMGKRYNIF